MKLIQKHYKFKWFEYIRVNEVSILMFKDKPIYQRIGDVFSLFGVVFNASKDK